jgi:hypothetical protein
MTITVKASLVAVSMLVSHGASGQTPAAPPLSPRAATCTAFGTAGFLQVATRTTPPVSTNPAYLRIDDQCWWDFNAQYRITAFPNGDVTYYFCNACAKPVTFGFLNLGSAQVLTRCQATDLVAGDTVTVAAQSFSPPQICDTGSRYGAFMTYDISGQVSGGARVVIDPEIVLDRSGRAWFRLAELQIATGARLGVAGAVAGDWVDGLRQQGAVITTASSATPADALLLGASTADELAATVARMNESTLKMKTIWLLRPPGTERMAVLPENLEYASEDQTLSTGFVAAQVRRKAAQQ